MCALDTAFTFTIVTKLALHFLLRTFTVLSIIFHLCPHLLFFVFLQQVSRVVERQGCDRFPPLVDNSGVQIHLPALGQIRMLLPAWPGAALAQSTSVCPAVKS